MAFTGTALRTAKLDLTLLGCESLITCSPLVRLGDKGQTIISARISNGTPDLDLTGWAMGFEATVGDKLIRDENQSRFRLVGKNTVEYKCSDEVHSFIGTVNVAYFTLKKDGTTVTTQNFSIHSLQNAETGTDGLKEHYVSVIDDLVKANDSVLEKAEEIKGLIDKNQVVRKSGDIMSGNLEFDRTKGVLFKNGDGISVMSLTADNLNRFVGFSDAANENVFVYDPSTKFFDLRSGTNLLKKTGDTMTGDINMDTTANSKMITGYRDGKATSALYFVNDNVSIEDRIRGKSVWQYDSPSETFTLYTPNTNLLKETDVYAKFVHPEGKTYIIDGQDLNAVSDPGQYSGQNMLNTPSGASASATFYYVEVMKHNTTGYVKQVATTLATTTPQIYFRTKNSGTNWGAWQQVIDAKGGTLTGDFIINTPNKGLKVGNGVEGITQMVDTNGRYYWYSTSGKTPFYYDIKNDTMKTNCPASINSALTMTGANARLVIDEGGQSVTFDQPTAQVSARGFVYRENGAIIGGIGRIRSTTDAYNYMGWGAEPWNTENALVVSDKVLKYKGKDIAFKDKDGRADLTLTADATNWNSNRPVIATRRGNTVTLRGAIALVSSYAGANVTTLPSDMRPTDSFTVDILANDGTSHAVSVFASGEISFGATAKGKQLSIMLTYVVN
ncbi:TPA: BppU family phage baseplate upper protein [Bacillus paranthracis]|nr:BppU family phage baseplate upper protein [Bacillus paranthracis]HDR7304504.1 BppU family phage baseplate upper protein [Bacillus paranthracis]